VKVNRSGQHVITTFTLSATDDNDQAAVVNDDIVEVAIKPLGVQPTEDDWVVCHWSTVNPSKVQVVFNPTTGTGFAISTWEPGTYWWKVRPHDTPETPVLDGPNYFEIA
jgi:hypothetical protein